MKTEINHCVQRTLLNDPSKLLQLIDHINIVGILYMSKLILNF